MNVLITGASGGLGRALAIECAERGYNLFLTDINDTGLVSVKNGLERQFGTEIYIKCCDLTDEGETKTLIKFINNQDFKLDMLLNVAGIDYEGGFLQRGFEEIISILKLNIEATLRITREALLCRRPDSNFYVVFVSSLASMYPMPLKATYAASKRFLLDFSIALGQEMKKEKVTVLSLCPAGLATTPESICGIEAQGFWGRVTANRLEKVAHQTISRVLKNRHLYIPGVMNRFLSIVGKVIPPAIIAKLLYVRWNKAQKKWLVIR